jgi:hypothetical protein
MRVLGPFICCICGRAITDDHSGGRNPGPFPGEQCCKSCDQRFVLPVRLATYEPDATVEKIEELMATVWLFFANAERLKKMVKDEYEKRSH